MRLLSYRLDVPSMNASDTRNPVLYRLALLASYVRRMSPVLLGNMLGWYEFSLYQYLFPEMLENYFKGDETVAQLWFACFCFFRVLGGFLFGWFADTQGRQAAIVLSLSGIFVFTFAQALLPPPMQVYWGTPGRQIGLVMLVICRVIQSFCTGGELAIIIPYILETTPADMRCTMLSLYNVFHYMAFVLGASVVALLRCLLGKENMLTLGWRLPFLLATGPAILSWNTRRRIYETEEFKQTKRLANDVFSSLAEPQRHAEASSCNSQSITPEAASCTPVRSPALAASSREQNSACARPAAAGNFLLILPAVSVVMVTAACWVVVWESESCLGVMQAHGVIRVQTVGVHVAEMMVAMMCMFLTAHVVDVVRAGPRVTLETGLALIVLFWTPAHAILLAFPGNFKVAFFIVALSHGLMIGIIESTLQPFAVDRWPVELRCRGFGVCQNVAAAIASFTPLAHTKLTSWSEFLPALYTTAFAVVGFLAVRWDAKLQQQGIVELAHFPLAAGVELVPAVVPDGAMSPSATSQASEASCHRVVDSSWRHVGPSRPSLVQPPAASVACTPKGSGTP